MTRRCHDARHFQIIGAILLHDRFTQGRAIKDSDFMIESLTPYQKQMAADGACLFLMIRFFHRMATAPRLDSAADMPPLFSCAYRREHFDAIATTPPLAAGFLQRDASCRMRRAATPISFSSRPR